MLDGRILPGMSWQHGQLLSSQGLIDSAAVPQGRDITFTCL
jgi:hypothetical protein